MKLSNHNVIGNVEINTSGDDSNFTIKTTSKAFKILSSGLYSNKIQAIIREISCNAYDAHIDANQHIPFDVYLPTADELDFQVRDYGLGLSNKDVHNIFTTYFESTKTESNDVIGALGLGSKSPFCYTDQFTVTSWYGGKQRIYTCYMSESGEPRITLMSSTPSNEHTGLAIKLAVKNCDIHNFHKSASDVFKWFNQKPNIIRNTYHVKMDRPKFAYSSKQWHMHTGTPLAIQGNIAYPIDTNAIPNIDHDLATLVNDLSLVIEFDIGDLDVAASRESLSYDRTTCANILNRLNIIKRQIDKNIKKIFSRIDHEWDAKVKLNDLKSNHPLYRIYLNQKPVTWKGSHLTYTYDLSNIQRSPDLNKKAYISLLQTAYTGKPRRSATGVDGSVTKTTSVKPSEQYIFVVNDLPNGRSALSRCKHLMTQQNEVQTVIMILPSIHASRDEFNEGIESALSKLGNPQYTLASTVELPKPEPKQKNNVGNIHTAPVLIVTNKCRYEYNTVMADHYTQEDVDFDKDGFYMPLTDGTTKNIKGISSAETDHCRFLFKLKELGALPKNVHIVAGNKRVMKWIEKGNGKWTNVIKWLKRDLPTHLNCVKETERKLAECEYVRQSQSDYSGIITLTQTRSSLDVYNTPIETSNPFTDLTQLISTIGNKEDPRIRKIVAVARAIDDQQHFCTNTKRAFEQATHAFPMLKYMDYNSWQESRNVNQWKDAVDYVNAMTINRRMK